MEGSIFKKAIIISLLGHLSLFSMFSFSLGTKMVKPDYGVLAFWGQIFNASDLKSVPFNNLQGSNDLLFKKSINVPKSPTEINNPLAEFNLKPKVSLAISDKKQEFTKESPQKFNLANTKQPAIMFHPVLPYNFSLLFNDRQLVHIELAFNIASDGPTNHIVIKRKISSGNLEADLLTMRYIGHYLFIQQPWFTPDNWNTVKIDLSAKENN